MNSFRLSFLVLLLSITNFTFSQQNSDSRFTVVVDAGHGGKDPGNTGNGYLEKKIALSIALKLGKKLEDSGVKVVYTRKSDVFVNLFERANIANRSNAQLFVSIHCDSHTSQAYGAGTFVLGLHANQRNFEVAKK
ncbi:MAG: N-acetylmuramoyl-L-alanine amidase, partial [Flammeovirgaceae bacterium]